MASFITVPREALAKLLKDSGSPLTPEEFSRAQPEMGAFKKYPGRAWAAAFDKYFLLVIAVFSVVLLPFLGFTVENMIICLGLCTVTYFEFRVHRYFSENDPRAPDLGFRNQAAFSACIILYCLYHAFMPMALSTEDRSMLNQSGVLDEKALNSMVKVFYFVIALIAGGSQFALAWYYRSAKSA